MGGEREGTGEGTKRRGKKELLTDAKRPPVTWCGEDKARHAA